MTDDKTWACDEWINIDLPIEKTNFPHPFAFSGKRENIVLYFSSDLTRSKHGGRFWFRTYITNYIGYCYKWLIDYKSQSIDSWFQSSCNKLPDRLHQFRMNCKFQYWLIFVHTLGWIPKIELIRTIVSTFCRSSVVNKVITDTIVIAGPNQQETREYKVIILYCFTTK